MTDNAKPDEADKVKDKEPPAKTTEVEPKEGTNSEPIDHTVLQAKIEQLEKDNAAKDAALKAKDDELKASKAKNFDLLMALPKEEEPNPTKSNDEPDEIRSTEDLFG